MGKTIIITGSTGMVGGLVLKNCLESNEVDKVIVINRSKLKISHPKIEEIIIKDFLDYSEIIDKFENVDIAYYCLGVYGGTVSKADHRLITVDYNKAFTDALFSKSPNTTYCYFSGMGADRDGTSMFAFGKNKGDVENYLLKIGFPKVLIFRPGYIYPVTPRKEPNFGYWLQRQLYPLTKLFMSSAMITSEELAKFIFSKGIEGKETATFENKDMKTLLKDM